MTYAVIDLVAVEAVFLVTFAGIISFSMWHKAPYSLRNSFDRRRRASATAGYWPLSIPTGPFLIFGVARLDKFVSL